MEGGAGESRGIYSRALHDLFSTIRARSKEAAYSVRVSMVEIYKWVVVGGSRLGLCTTGTPCVACPRCSENIIDLLSPTAATTAHAAVLDAEEGQHSLEVRQVRLLCGAGCAVSALAPSCSSSHRARPATSSPP